MMASCTVGFQPFHFFCLFVFFHLCNTFIVHHRESRFVTQRHIVKTDVWQNWALSGIFSDLWSVFQLNIQRSGKSDSEIRLVPGLSLMRLTANGKVLVLADCLHLVDWGGTSTSGNKLPWGKIAPWHRELGSAFSSVNLFIHHPDSKYKLWLTQGNHLHPTALAHSMVGVVRMRGVKYFLDYMFSSEVRLAMCCSDGE